MVAMPVMPVMAMMPMMVVPWCGKSSCREGHCDEAREEGDEFHPDSILEPEKCEIIFLDEEVFHNLWGLTFTPDILPTRFTQIC